jgi:hypothetical protein
MPKEFYTERDIEDMVKRGILSLELNDQVVMTDLAYEKANKLGMRLVREKPDNPPAAPVRPYLSQQASQTGVAVFPAPTSQPLANSPAVGKISSPNQPDGEDVHERIKSAVISRLGSQVDANLLDVIITRVLQNTGVK